MGPLTLLILTQSMISWGVFAPPVVAMQALPDIGLNPIWIGGQPSIVFIAAMIIGVLASSWVAKINPMRATQIFVFCTAVGVILISTGHIVSFIVGSALIGTALGPATPASSHILARVTPENLQPLVFSIRQSSVPLGGVLAGVITPLLMEQWGWQISLMTIAIPCLVSIAIVEIWVKSYNVHAISQDKHSINFIEPIKLVLSIPSLKWLTLGMMPLVIAQYSLTTFIVIYLQKDINLSVITAGWVLGIAQAAGAGGRILFGLLAVKFAHPLIVLICLSALACISSILTSLQTEYWALGIIFLVGAIFGASAAGWNGVFLAETARQSPGGTVSKVTGGVTFFIFGALVLGPAGFAFLIEQTSFAFSYTLIGITLIISIYSFIRCYKEIKSKK